MIITFENGQYKTEKKGYVQYDYGQEIQFEGLAPENLMFQFVKNGVQYNSQGVYSEGIHTVKVPDEVLVESGPFAIYCFYEQVSEGHTEKVAVIDVIDREMYPPRDPEEYHDIIAQILERLDELQYEIDHFELTPEQLEYIVEQVEDAIDLTDYYDKEEVNTLLADKANVSDIPDISGLATKTEVSNGLALKADKSDTYTKQQVDNLIPDVSNFATNQDVSNAVESLGSTLLPIIQAKANSADVYTKNQTDNLLNDKANAADVYTKSEVYNKTEIDATLGNILTLLEAI